MPISNDADLGGNIDQEAQVTKSHPSRGKRFPNDDAHLEPSRWWFLSSAFPMIAGALGPVASAFSICSLAEPWRQHLVPGGDIQDATSVPDPMWLTIVEAIQLLIGITSNIFLLLNMARRVRFRLAQFITIIGWYISALCRTSLSATVARPLKDSGFPQNELIWSQAFYYGMWAAILYFVDASLMAATFWGASTGRYRKDFILTLSQRTLMLQTIMFLIYLLLGAYIFSQVESWNYLDAVYWTVVTLFTVGFGDYYPTTTLGRALLIPYALIGIITLGLVISSVRSLILDRGRRCIAARMTDRKRRKMIRTIIRSGDDKILEPIGEQFEITHTQSKKAPANEFKRREVEFALMRKIQAKSSSHRRWAAMAISTISWLVLWLVGAVVFEKAEKPYQGWSYFDSFYFCFEAWTTIGYGDLAPISNAGRSFYVFWSLLALPTMTVLISHASDTVVRLIRNGTILLGNVTILPDDGGFVGNMKHIISKITFGRVFPGHLDFAPPEPAVSSKNIDQGLAGAMTEFYEETLRDDDRGCPSTSVVDQGVSQNSGPQRTGAPSTFTSRVRCNHRDELPTGTDFHFLLISEVQVIATHLKESKPHRYTFDQWAWYLKLIGEDEHNPQTHGKVKLKGKRQDPNDEDSDRGLTWSWVGNRSPLVGSQEESEWIFNRLTDRLRESLLSERKRQLRSGAREAYPKT
ncbi:hypothetical protein B0J13DRAFT_314906 [Dactylonectria estremocensis]|uniref:Potassium channel domain-containing protein n=1 Tax=Dactylonectria estremocensis TaxID=1079267 RepID=A0A9P9CYN4_9HYPO|nr:hypothetical protein B0J13DRAFT_314906 [Dactylonectria estremocensis]